MRLIPTSLERIILLVAILAFLAWLVPQSWLSSIWAGNQLQCNAWLVAFAGILMMSCIIAGTKRQLLVALVASLPLALLLILLPAGSIDKLYDEKTVGSQLFRLASLSDGLAWLCGSCVVLFVVSWIASFPLDRVLRPVWSSDGLEKIEEATGSGDKRSFGGFRIVLVVLAGLILFQALNNLAGTTLGFASSAKTVLIPLGLLAACVFAVGLICRLRALYSFMAAIVLGAVSTAGAITFFIERGYTVENFQMATIFGMAGIMIAVPFLLLGRLRQPLEAKFGLTSLLMVAITGGVAFFSTKYDWHTFLLSYNAFDFGDAALVKDLNSNSSVRTSWVFVQPRFGSGQLSFEFLSSEGADSFFNELDASGFPTGGRNSTSIYGMSETVDLSQISKVNSSWITVANSRLSSQQLADLFQTGVAVNFVSCTFVPAEVRDPVAISGRTSITNAQESGIKDFIEAIGALELQTGLTFHADGVDDADIEAVLAFVEDVDDEYRIHISGRREFDADLLGDRENCGQLFWQYGRFQVDEEGVPHEPDSFSMLLKSEIGISGHIQDPRLLWKLALAAKGDFWPGVQATGSEADYIVFDRFSETVFVYSKNESGKATALWLPWCDDKVFNRSCSIPSLKALSFDVEWLGNEDITSPFSALSPVAVDVTPVNRLRDLEELYFSSREQIDFSVLKPLERLKTIQFASSCKGFRKELFPKLEEVRILLDSRIQNPMMRELKKMESVQSLVVVDLHSTNFSKEKFLEQANDHFNGRIKISVIDVEDIATIAPDEFIRYRLKLRDKCISEYLGE